MIVVAVVGEHGHDHLSATGALLERRWNGGLEAVLEFGILGPLQVRDGNRRIEVPSTKERRLLAMLVVHANEVVSIERLIEAIWGATPPVTAANTLQTYVSHLRRALEPDHPPRAKDGVLRTHGRGYELVVAPDAVDATRFERLVRDGRHALADDPERAAESLRVALGLWRGEPLAEFSGELFAEAEIARLTELCAVAVEDRVEADLALGRHAALCSELSRAVVQQPLRERLWSQLIRALYRCGRQADAMAAYARLREQLAEQLGIQPSPELVRLHEAVLAQRPDLDWRPAPTQPSGEPSGSEEEVPTAKPTPRAEQPPSAEDLESLAESAWRSGRYREGLTARQRAHHAFLQAGDNRRAAFDAVILTIQYAGFRQFAVANGWFQRAQRLLAPEPDSADNGYLSWATTAVALGTGDHEKCLAAARSTSELGVRHGVAELHALGVVFQGTVLIHRGQVADGLALHDEGMAMAIDGSLSQLATTQIFCQVIRTCYELSDYRRAQEWTHAIEDCFARIGLTSFPGECGIHRIAILINRGAWALAEQEAQRICVATQCFDLVHAGQAFASIGDVRLRRGDLAGAEEAFAKAEEMGAGSLPGRARLRLLRGCPRGAAELINAGLAGDGWDRLRRRWLLPDQVTIALAVDDVDTARRAAAELAESARLYGGKALLASAEAAHGAVAMATGDDDPLPLLSHSVELWRQAGSPYEGARAQVLLATALKRAGRTEAAAAELATARACFERLGARLDAQAAAADLAPGAGLPAATVS